jgi:putative oxidoreductase
MVQRYALWAPVVARILFGVFFLQAAAFKFPGSAAFAGNVAYTADKLPFPALAVTLAFALEVVTGLALVLGWHTRLAAAALVPYIALLTLLFHMTFASQVDYGFFIDHLLLIAGLLYVSGHGAQHFALRKDGPVV